MPIGERFKDYAQNPDPRFVELERLRMNCAAHSGNYASLMAAGYFDILKELLSLFPDSKVFKQDDTHIPFLSIQGLQIVRDPITMRNEKSTVCVGVRGLFD
ncbi:MAG: hypothetical protein Q8R11_00770, partial [bacterium]|nr:hypothetical protein [bacterium]